MKYLRFSRFKTSGKQSEFLRCRGTQRKLPSIILPDFILRIIFHLTIIFHPDIMPNPRKAFMFSGLTFPLLFRKLAHMWLTNKVYFCLTNSCYRKFEILETTEKTIQFPFLQNNFLNLFMYFISFPLCICIWLIQ